MVKRLFHEHAPALAVVATFTGSTLAASHWAPGMAVPLLDWPSLFVLPALLLCLTPLPVISRRWRFRLPWRVAYRDARAAELATPRLAGALCVLVLVRFTLLNAVAWKASIPVLHPFRYDVALAQLDRMLHGRDAWRLLPGVGTRLLDTFYAGWFVAFTVFVFYWAWRRWDARRARVLATLVLTWALGSWLAVLVPSAGPVYYGAVTGQPDPFLALHARLADAPIAAALQGRLWQAYTDGGGGWIKGIAAFPSLHVAMPALYALVHRGWLRWAWAAFTLVTLVGSVALAWHYAVDGYAGILIAALAWGASGMVPHD